MNIPSFGKILLTLLVLVLLLLVHRPVMGAGLSGEALRNRLDSLTQVPEKEIDLAETLLWVSKDWDPSLDLQPYRDRLDQLTESVRKKISTGATPAETVAVLRDVIHQEGGYRYTDRVDSRGIPLEPKELFLHGLLDTRRGYCMTLSFLYLIVGDRLGLPLKGVALPNHFFVRYDAPGTRINIEATEGGVFVPDDVYYQRFGVSSDPPDPFFMKDLGKKQTLGAYFSNVGMVFYQQEKTRKAVVYLQRAVAINPLSLEARNNLGNIYSVQKKYEDAIREYLEALKTSAFNIATLNNLGLAYADNGQVQKAIDTFLRALAADPDFGPAHDQLVKLYLSQKRFHAALGHLNWLVKANPGNLQLHLALTSIYLQLKNYDLALQTLRQAAVMFPESPVLIDQLAEVYYRMKDFDSAIYQYRYLVERDPENLRPYVQMGWTFYRKNDIESAIAWTRRGLAMAQRPEAYQPLAQMNLGLFYVLTKNFSEAEYWYQLVLDHKEKKMRDAMLTDLEEAAGKNPGLPEAAYFRGWILLETGEKTRAERLLRNYLDRRPGGPLAGKARKLLARLPDAAPPSSPQAPAPAPGKTGKNPGISTGNIAFKNMVKVPAGFFIMGSNRFGQDEKPEHRVYLDTFYIDKYEASAKEYSKFLNQAGNTKGYYLDNKYGTLEYGGRFTPRPGLESYPINNVSWFGAEAYCRWKKKRLPTEAEWEKAARGPLGQPYPWGDAGPSPSRARYLQTWTEERKHRVMVPVDALPEGKSPYGAYNMAGNVKEWVDDWHDREYYAGNEHNINPRGPIGGEYKILRGGSWRDLSGFIYSSFRNNNFPENRMDDYGFRCVKSPQSSSAPKKLTQSAPLPGGENPADREPRFARR